MNSIYFPSQKNQLRTGLILFFLYPLIALFWSIKNIRTKVALNIIWAFCVFHGFNLISSEGKDSFRYGLVLKDYYSSNLSWDTLRGALFSQDNVDVLEPILTFIISQFTDNPRILFAAFGFVFGYFYSRNIGYVIGCLKNISGINYYLLVLTFAIVIPFWDINGFRMWTAAHIFFYATIRIFYERDFKFPNLLILALAPLTHFSFIIPVTVLILFMTVTFKNILLMYVFVLSSFLINELDITIIRDLLLSFSPDFLERKIRSYTHEGQLDAILEKKENFNFYIKYQSKALSLAIVFILTKIVINRRDIFNQSSPIHKFFSFSLLLLGIGNILSLIPSGVRFIDIGNLFILASTAIIIINHKFLIQESPMLKNTILLCLLFYNLIAIWQGFQTISVMTLFGNPILAIITNMETSMSELIKIIT